ncbi:hypothetical protein K466DRAFT_668157 [Polyporus arcularius HHB13444]|uniref:Homeobox domain-containing protein n=1 Tax=Polyporus arcularius HHB13444 TaxID=1314778 RepID=A0A5C3P0N1_9APHY|nr:hypothetical protein K466DRAFT_668157 [Polyporus arcularius HHB13444]
MTTPPSIMCAACTRGVDRPWQKLCATCQAIPPADITPLNRPFAEENRLRDHAVKSLHWPREAQLTALQLLQPPSSHGQRPPSMPQYPGQHAQVSMQAGRYAQIAPWPQPPSRQPPAPQYPAGQRPQVSMQVNAPSSGRHSQQQHPETQYPAVQQAHASTRPHASFGRPHDARAVSGAHNAAGAGAPATAAYQPRPLAPAGTGPQAQEEMNVAVTMLRLRSHRAGQVTAATDHPGPSSASTHGVSTNPSTSGKRRTMFTNSQKDALIAYFLDDPYPTIQDREQLAVRLGLNRPAVDRWFQNTRSRQYRALGQPSVDIQ